MTAALRTIPAELGRFEKLFLAVGGAAAAASLVAAVESPEGFFRSYLVAYLFWLGLSLGSLAILMLQHLSGGAWAMVIRRLLEAAARTLPLMAALFLPLVPGLKHLYVWTDLDQVARDELLQHKSSYLNVPFFLVRALVYFAVWLALAFVLGKWSHEQDESSDPRLARRMQLVSGPGLALFVLTMTFASIDWAMSLEPHWFSTIYGALFIVGQVLGAFSFAIAMVIIVSRREPLSSVLSQEHLHDLGKLLLAFVMVWTYFAFCQFLIIWAGNLPEEIPWYLRRLTGGWQWIALALVLGQFAMPFLLLLSRNIKRDSKTLARVAILVILLRVVDLHWMIVPAFRGRTGGGIPGLDLVLLVAVGGLWLGTFLRRLKERPLLPVGDPHLEEALAHGRR